MKTKLMQLLQAAVLLAASHPAMALQGLDVTPGTASVSVRLDIPAITFEPGGLPARPTFRDLFRGHRVSISFSPSGLALTWRPECQNEPAEARSTEGRFQAGGGVLAVVGTNLSTVSPCPNGVQSVAETVTLPDAVHDRIVRNILDAPLGMPVGELTPARLRGALERAAARAVSGLTYRRTWQSPGSTTGPETGSVVLSLGAEVAGRIRLNFSRLVGFNGSSRVDGASLLGASRPVPVTWSGTVEQVGQGSPLTLRSRRFLIRSGSGAIVGQGSRPLTRSGIRSGSAVFEEIIKLSSNQLLQARQAGGGLVLERTLTDDFGNSFTARVPLNLTGPGQADFAVTAMKCRFHDGARVKVFREGDPVHVVCDLRFDGPGGLLRGTWETAEGGGSRLFFRPLQLYSNFVVGQNRVQISRTFTARGTGRHVVRFRVEEPELLVGQTAIQYYVGVSPDQVSPTALPSPLSVLTPVPNSIAEQGLEISWSDVPATATHVLVEFFTPDQLFEEPDPNELEQRSSSLLVRGEPRAGLVVPADRDKAEITPLTAAHLVGEGRIYMRISALEDGLVVGVSPLRRLNAP